MGGARTAIETSCGEPDGGDGIRVQPRFVATAAESQGTTCRGNVPAISTCKMAGDGGSKQPVTAATDKAEGAFRTRGDRMRTCGVVFNADGRNKSSGCGRPRIKCMKGILE